MSNFVLTSDRNAVQGFLRRHEIAHARAQDEVLRDSRRDAPVSVSRGLKLNAGDTQGSLAASLTGTTPVRNGGTVTSRTGSSKIYFAMRELGGTIRPVRKERLAWRDPVTGKWIVLPKGRAVVQRPGGPRNGYRPFMGPAVARWPQYLERHLRAMSR